MTRLAQKQNAKSTTAQQHRYEHFTELAKEAARRGDYVQMESFYQHAEHVLRMMRYPDQA